MQKPFRFISIIDHHNLEYDHRQHPPPNGMRGGPPPQGRGEYSPYVGGRHPSPPTADGKEK